MDLINKQVYKRAIEFWGEEAQKSMFYEEFGELLQAMNKYKRDDTDKNYYNIREEIADVEIMLNQLKLIYGEQQINKIKQTKIGKLEDVLNKIEGDD